MARILLDASVLITYLASRNPTSTALHQLLLAAGAGAAELLWSSQVAEEVVRKIAARPYLAERVTAERAFETLAAFASVSVQVLPPISDPPLVCRDPNDDYLVAAALAGRADLVVTLDDGLLALDGYAGVRFVKPGAALATVRESGDATGDP